MDKQRALKIVNPLLGLAFVFQFASGFAMKWAGDWYEAWERAHGLCGYVLLALVVAHVWLNWGWIKNAFLKRKSPST